MKPVGKLLRAAVGWGFAAVRERAAASLSRCGAWREGSCKQTVALHIPSSACSIPARFAGTGLVLWDPLGQCSAPQIVIFPAESIRNVVPADGCPWRHTAE